MINRMVDYLATQKMNIDDLFRQIHSEIYQGRKVYKMSDFVSMCERSLNMNTAEATQLGQAMVSSVSPAYVDYDNFAQVVTTETNKFQPILAQYDMELSALHTSLKTRHTGVHKWFQ